MSKILMVASEAVPFAKSGGLADVLGALPQALAGQGHEVAVVLPRYGEIPLDGLDLVAGNLAVVLGVDSYTTAVYTVSEGGVPYFLIDCPELYDRDGLYSAGGADFPDNHLRFAMLCRSALNVVRHLYRARILHCHDWQGALVAPFLKSTLANDPTFFGVKTVLTIHNLGYQGIFGPEGAGQVGLTGEAARAAEFRGDSNFLKAGILLSNKITTVSPGYAREIQTPEYGCGLDALLRQRTRDLVGILNGVDYAQWNPETDPHIAANYSADDLSGKLRCKRDLLEAFALPPDDLTLPVLGIVSRFTSQKGFDLIEKIAPSLAAESLYLVALGTGESRYEEQFRNLASAHPDRIAVRIAYDNALAHRIEAGADMFLMPSHYEPCGLNQIYSLRYGTVPVVRATGGLDDTIDEETGFKFSDYTPEALLAVIHAALEAYATPEQWRTLMLRGMARDYSWNTSAARYSDLYRGLLS